MTGEYSILDMLRNQNDIIRAEIMSDEMKKNITQFEMTNLKGKIPTINQGLDKALKENESIILIKDFNNNKKLYDTYKPRLLLINENKEIIGKEIKNKEEITELNKNEYKIISENFIIFPQLDKPEKNKFFIIPECSTKFIISENIKDKFKSLTIALPSKNSHEHIMKSFKIENNGTYIPIIVGFTN